MNIIDLKIVDIEKAFDLIKRNKLIKVLMEMKIPLKLIIQ